MQDKPPETARSPALVERARRLLGRRQPMRLILAGLVAIHPLVAAGSGAQTPVFPAGAERVIVDVVVTDENGKPVAGLQREDFVVEDEGTPQAIIEFEAVDATGPAG